jgi:hypothetical protein
LTQIEVEVVGRVGPADRDGEDPVVDVVEARGHVDEEVERVAVLSFDAGPPG